MIRSKSLCLQVPANADWARLVTPFMSPSSTSSSVQENCPDYQRVTISGDYCAGVSTLVESANWCSYIHIHPICNNLNIKW